MYTLSYHATEQLFNTANAALSVAESHGCLAGALCVQAGYSVEHWLAEILPDGPPGALTTQPADIQQPVQQIHHETFKALEAGEMTFMPLLPADDATLALRTQALALWSQGFLYGFGLYASVLSPAALHAAEEVLRDFAEIARANTLILTDTELEEQAFTELVEYVRAGTQMLYDELFEQRQQQMN